MNPCKEESTFLITRKFLAKFLIKSSVDSFGETRSSSPNKERSSFSLFFVSGVKNLSIGYLFLRLSIIETQQKQIYYIYDSIFSKKSHSLKSKAYIFFLGHAAKVHYCVTHTSQSRIYTYTCNFCNILNQVYYFTATWRAT